MDQHYSISEVAKLNLSQKTIRRHIASGDLISYKLEMFTGLKKKISQISLKKTDLMKGQSTIFPKWKFQKNKKGDDVNWCKIDDLWSKIK